MKNIARDSSGRFRWKMNLNVIEKNIPYLNEGFPRGYCYNKPTLFIRGENSKYIRDDDMQDIQDSFLRQRLKTLQNAGHWVQVDAPEEFAETVLKFLSF